MPIIKSAQKKMRKDVKRTAHNKTIKDNLKGLLKNMRRTPSQEAYNQTASALDKAVKTNLIHKNKASRLKSRAAAFLASATK